MKKLFKSQSDESDGFDNNCGGMPDPMADVTSENQDDELIDPTADLVREPLKNDGMQGNEELTTELYEVVQRGGSDEVDAALRVFQRFLRVTFATGDNSCDNLPDPTDGLLKLEPGRPEPEPIENGLEEIRRKALMNLLEQKGEFILVDKVNNIPAVPEKWQVIRIEIEDLSPDLGRIFSQDLHAYIPEDTCETIISMHQNKIAIIPKAGYFPKTGPKIKALRIRLQNFINLLYQEKYQSEGLTVSIKV